MKLKILTHNNHIKILKSKIKKVEEITVKIDQEFKHLI